MSPRRPPPHRTHTEQATHERIVREILAARSEQRLDAAFEQKCWDALVIACEIPKEILRAGQPAGLRTCQITKG